MEEDKKEIVNGEEKSDKKRFSHFCHCSLSGHKVMRVVLLAVGIFVILSIGVGIGSHSSKFRENNNRFSEKGNFGQRGSRMMPGERNNGGRFMPANNNRQTNGGGFRMMNSVDTQFAPLTPVVPAVPAKAASSTVIK